jgi:hypothetical protein
MRMISPVPNLNGSKASDLAEQMMEVRHALAAAETLMMRWQPHGRDYQIGGDYQADRQEFLRRLGLVTAMIHQYEDEAQRVMDYHYNRGRKRA